MSVKLEKLEVAKRQIREQLADYLIKQGVVINKSGMFRCINPAHDDKNPSAGIFNDTAGGENRSQYG